MRGSRKSAKNKEGYYYEVLRLHTRDFERTFLLREIARHDCNLTTAAAHLGLNYRTLMLKVRELELRIDIAKLRQKRADIMALALHATAGAS